MIRLVVKHPYPVTMENCKSHPLIIRIKPDLCPCLGTCFKFVSSLVEFQVQEIEDILKSQNFPDIWNFCNPSCPQHTSNWTAI